MTTEIYQQPSLSRTQAWSSNAGLLGREVINGVWPLATLCIAWAALFFALPPNTFLKGPVEVASYLTNEGQFAKLISALSSSLFLVVLGYLVAIVLSALLASAIVLNRSVESLAMPIAVVIGSVPIIVITPVMLMLFGRGIGTAVIVCTVVTFFPCLINIIAGMRSPASQLIDLTRTLGASSIVTLLKVRFPSAVPGLISASKLALPAALSGVILTEFIATGSGIGNYINHGRANFVFNEMWAGIAATLIASVLLYSVLGAVETILRRRYAPIPERGSRD